MKLGRLLKIAKQSEPGPLPTFAPYHLILVFLVVGGPKAIGRQALARETGLGEGAVRTLLSKLRREGYLTVTPSGCSLTKRGKELLSQVRRAMPELMSLKGTNLTVGEQQTAILVRRASSRVSNGIGQRDAAIKAGAEGATTFVIKGSKFCIPGGSDDCEKDYPSDIWGKLKELLRPRNGDAVIVCGSSDAQSSMYGALSAALTLVH